MSILVEQDLLETMRCSLCNNLLSIPPITIISRDGNEQICGRCSNINTGFATRNNFFEKIAAKAKFPCRYSGCEKIIRWGKVQRHEENCIYRTMKCPMFQSCEDMVQVDDLRWHFLREHEENVNDSFVDVPIYFDKYTISILEMGCTVCMIARYFTKELFWFQVYSLHRDDNFEYELKLNYHDSGKFSSSFKSKAVFFEENYHCFRCSIGKCQERSHKNSTLYNQSLPASDLSTALELLEVPLTTNNLRATLNIIWDENNISPVAVSKNNSSLIDRILQCPVCEEFMTPPIFICSRGHSVCNVCKPKLNKCPTCRSSFGTSRNFVLEDIADSVELFCKWKDEGCNFMGNVHKASQHHQNCEYKRSINVEDD